MATVTRLGLSGPRSVRPPFQPKTATIIITPAVRVIVIEDYTREIVIPKPNRAIGTTL